MVNVIVNKDGTLELTPLIANVSDKNVVESLYLTYDNQPGTLKYLVYVDDYDATHTKLVSANNTVSLNSYKSSSLQIQLKMINAASGEIVFESQWATLQLANVDNDCDCDYPRPPVFGPCGPHTPPPHHGFKPPKNYLYDFYSKLHTALGVEITNREQGDAKLAEMVASGNSTIADTLSEVIDKLDKHISDMTPLVIKGTVGENVLENQLLVNTDITYAEVCEAIETHRAIYIEVNEWGLNQAIPIYSFVDSDAAKLFIPSTEVVLVQFNLDGSVYAQFLTWDDFTNTYSEIDNISMSTKGLIVTNYASSTEWNDSDVVVNKVTENGTISHKLTEKANRDETINVEIGYESELDNYISGVYKIAAVEPPGGSDTFYYGFSPYYVFADCIDFVANFYTGATIWQTKITGSGVYVRRYLIDNSPSAPVIPPVIDVPDFEYTEQSESASYSSNARTMGDMFSGGEWTEWFNLLSEDSSYHKSEVDVKIQTLVEVDEEVIDKVEANSLAIEKLQKKRVVGFATMKPLVEGVTSQLKLAYVGDLIGGTNYTYTLKRNDAEVISWQKQSANDTSSSVTVATSLLISEGNTIVIKDGEELVCEAELEIYNLNETIMLQLVAYSE